MNVKFVVELLKINTTTTTTNNNNNNNNKVYIYFKTIYTSWKVAQYIDTNVKLYTIIIISMNNIKIYIYIFLFIQTYASHPI